MDFFHDLETRRLVHQKTDPDLDAWLAEKPRVVYAGFDPTADSLHVGHMMGLIMLRRFQQAGHTPIAVVGGATGMIGDPSGRSDERNLLDEEQIEKNVAGIGEQMRSFLDFDGANPARLLNNYDWTSDWSYLEFLRDIGKNFPVNVMLGKDSVKSRLGKGDDSEGGGGLSYTEFSYMLLQAFDFYYLAKEHGCHLQAGGSDQWGNITAGIDLIRRMGLFGADGEPLQCHGMTWPLLTKSDGTKMGKSASGAVWLDAERTSPYQFYQYWINVDDADVGSCLNRLSFLPTSEITDLIDGHDPATREAQRRLAEELTELAHGPEGLATARRATEIFFGAEVTGLDDRTLGEIFADVPAGEAPRSALDGEGLPIVDALVTAGLAKSKGEARRTVEQGGAYVNNRRVDGLETTLTAADLASETVAVLRSGRKRYALLRFVAPG